MLSQSKKTGLVNSKTQFQKPPMKTWNVTQLKSFKFRNLNDVIQRIKSNVTIIDAMVRSGISISDTTERTIKICCFDHDEQTPSMVVSPSKGLFNCFGAGCSAGGDILAFVQQFHRLTFIDSVNWIVTQFAVDVADLVVEKTVEEKKLDRYKDINGNVAKFLASAAAENRNVLSVLKAKGISDVVAQRFLVGYSQNASKICAYLRAKGVTSQDIDLLQFTRDDIFTNRIIYPLFDANGRVVSFYGRALGDAAVKYIGMSKGTHPLIDLAVPYGLHIGKNHVSKEAGRLILVEGHNDVLGLHSHGIENVAAVMGAAPTQAHYATLHSMNIKNIIICPDGDEAGFRTIAAINDNRASHQQVKIVTIPDGSDPDEFVHEQGPAAFKKLISEAVYPIEIVLKNVAETFDSYSPTGKLNLSTGAMKYMAHLSGFEREFAFNELSTITGIERTTIEESVSMSDEAPLSDVELERKIIGECINDKSRAMHAVTLLQQDDFTSSKLSAMWSAVVDMIKKDIDVFSREMFITYAVDNEFLTEKEAPLVPTIQIGSHSSLDYAISKLTDLSLRRRLVKSASRLLVDSKAKKTDIHEALNSHMVQIATSAAGKKETSTAQQHILSTMNLIHERMANPGMPGLNIGKNWSKLMNVIMGLQKGHMLTVAGITKAGKTTIALNWNIQQLIHTQEPTLWINLEMNETDLVMRNLSILSGVENNRMKIGNITDGEKDAIEKAALIYHGFKLHVANMAGANVFDVINTIRRYVYTQGVRVVFIDYIQLIRTDRVRGKSALWEEQNEVVGGIRDITSKLGITCILISQLNRGAMADNSSSGQHVSGTIKLIQDSDCFMGIRKKQPEELDAAPHVNSSLQIEYNRHGPQGLEIDLEYKYASMRIREG